MYYSDFIELSVFDYNEFCQHLLTLSVDHPRQMVSLSDPGPCRW